MTQSKYHLRTTEIHKVISSQIYLKLINQNHLKSIIESIKMYV